MCTAILHAAALGLKQGMERGTPNKRREKVGKRVCTSPRHCMNLSARPDDASLDTPDEKHNNAIHTAYMYVRAHIQ